MKKRTKNKTWTPYSQSHPKLESIRPINNFDMKRALVVGGNGFLGRSIAGALRANPEWHIISADIAKPSKGADVHSAHQHIKYPPRCLSALLYPTLLSLTVLPLTVLCLTPLPLSYGLLMSLTPLTNTSSTLPPHRAASCAVSPPWSGCRAHCSHVVLQFLHLPQRSLVLVVHVL